MGTSSCPRFLRACVLFTFLKKNYWGRIKNMFDKLKQLKQLKEIQNSLKDERTTAERRGVAVVVNGNLKVEEIKLNPDLDKEDQEAVLKECINEAMQKMQVIAAQKMAQITGFGL